MQKNSRRPDMLNRLYQVSRMGMEASEIVLPKVGDSELHSQIEKQNRDYLDTMRQSQAMLHSRKRPVRNPMPSAQRAVSSVFRAGSGLRRSPGHLAGLMISGADAGINALEKALKNAPDEDPETRFLIERYIDREERNIDILKRFL